MSACGVFNINSGDATGIPALRGCAFLQGFGRPEKTLESRPPHHHRWPRGPESGQQCPRGRECPPGGGLRPVLPAQNSRGWARPQSEPWSGSPQPCSVKGPDRKCFRFCRASGRCHPELCCPAWKQPQTVGKWTGVFCSSETLFIKKQVMHQTGPMCQVAVTLSELEGLRSPLGFLLG